MQGKLLPNAFGDAAVCWAAATHGLARADSSSAMWGRSFLHLLPLRGQRRDCSFRNRPKFITHAGSVRLRCSSDVTDLHAAVGMRPSLIDSRTVVVAQRNGCGDIRRVHAACMYLTCDFPVSTRRVNRLDQRIATAIEPGSSR
jgi:hypothetical protein